MKKTFNAARVGACSAGGASASNASYSCEGASAAGGYFSASGGASAAGGSCSGATGATGAATTLRSNGTIVPTFPKNINFGKGIAKVARALAIFVASAAFWWIIGKVFPELRTEVLPDFYHIIDKILAGFNWLCSITLKIFPFLK